MTLQDHPLDFNNAPPARKARGANRMSVARLAELLNDRIGDLAVALLGTPNRELSSQQQLRFGTKGSVAVEIAGKDAGRWYDHEAGTGGAGLELIRHHLGLDEKPAWDWARNWLGEAGMPASWTAKPATTPAQGAAIHHCANEVTDAGPRGAKRQAILVGMGVHPGFADLMILCDGRVLFLELKSVKGRLSPTQEAFRDAVMAQGHGWVLVRSLDDALGALADHRFTTRVAAPVRRPAS